MCRTTGVPKPWLTLNLGARYDIFTPFTEVHGRFANYDPYLGLLVSPPTGASAKQPNRRCSNELRRLCATVRICGHTGA